MPPIALPTTLVSLPTDPKIWLPILARDDGAMIPLWLASSSSRASWASTTVRKIAACAAKVVPA